MRLITNAQPLTTSLVFSSTLRRTHFFLSSNTIKISLSLFGRHALIPYAILIQSLNSKHTVAYKKIFTPMHQEHVISSFIQTVSISLLTIIVLVDMTAEKHEE